MDKLKRFWKYFLNFIILYIIVSSLTWLCLKVSENRREVENETNDTIITE